MDLKRAMLIRLARKNTELYPNDPVKREKVYSKYKVVGVCLSQLSDHKCSDFWHNLNVYYKSSCAKNQMTCFFFFCFLLSQQQFEIPEEEAEWLGLSLEEAVEKQRQLEDKVTKSSNMTCLTLTSSGSGRADAGPKMYKELIDRKQRVQISSVF